MAADGVEHRAGVGVRGEPQTRAAGVDRCDRALPGVDPRRVDRDVDAQPSVRAPGLERPEVAVQHDATAVEQGDRLAQVLDEVELVAREEQVAAGAACAR